MRILITGAFGYLAYSVIDSLLKSNEDLELILYDNLQRNGKAFFHGEKLKNANRIQKIYFNDILDNHNLREALQSVDTVIHMAAKASTPFSDYQSNEFDQINNWGTANLADEIAMVRSIKKVIYLSTISVYGNTQGEFVNEDQKPNPHSFYGISKYRGEQHIMRLPTDIQTYIVRCANVFGYNPCFRTDAVINRFAFDAHFKNQIMIQGTGDQYRPFSSVDYVGDYIGHMAVAKKEYPKVLNLVENNYTINEIAEAIFDTWPNIEYQRNMQHMPMRSIAVESKYTAIIENKSLNLAQHLALFKQNFSL